MSYLRYFSLASPITGNSVLLQSWNRMKTNTYLSIYIYINTSRVTWGCTGRKGSHNSRVYEYLSLWTMCFINDICVCRVFYAGASFLKRSYRRKKLTLDVDHHAREVDVDMWEQTNSHTVLLHCTNCFIVLYKLFFFCTDEAHDDVDFSLSVYIT